MVTHRRTPSRINLILPGWFFVLSAVVSVVAAVALGLLVVRAVDDGSAPSASPSTSTPSTAGPSASDSSPSSTPSASPSASESPTPTPSATTDAPVDRSQYSVVVLNGTTTPGLASVGSARVQQIGWPSAGVGNWRGSVPATTVYYPAGEEAAGRLLAADLGVGAAPALAGMNPGRLTVVVLTRLG